MTVRRARLQRTGWDADLAIEEVAEPPAPQRDQVLVEVEACGVCFRDCIDRAGRFPFIQLPITPGHEAVGRVVAVGPDAGEWRVGDRVATMHRDFCGACPACAAGEVSLCTSAAAVLGLIIDGGYATHLCAPQRCFYRALDSQPAAHAAVMHCTFGTAFRGLRRAVDGDVDRLRGARVLVTGANGGVGLAAVQLAARLGAEVVAVVRAADHVDAVRDHGAAHVVVDAGGGFHKRVPGGAVNVALDCVGPPTFNAALRALQVGGTVVAIGNVVPDRVELNLGYAITRGLRIVGSSGASRRDMADLLALHERAPLRVVIDRELPLAAADEAQRAVQAGGLRGRVVVVP